MTKGPHTYHTTNPVPFIVVDEEKRPLRSGGALQDIAPTMLGMLACPAEGDDGPGSAAHLRSLRCEDTTCQRPFWNIQVSVWRERWLNGCMIP